MKTLLLSILLGALVLVCSAQQMQQTSNQGNDLLGRTVYQNLLTVEGFGYAAINNNRTSFTITFFGYGPNATTAREVLLNQISDLQGNLSDYLLLNRQQGGITYYPYSNSTFAAGAASRINGFVASTTLSFSISSSDAAFVLDILLNNSTAYISINARPDQLLISEAEALAVQNAMDDAIFKAQSALNRLGLCTLNITLLTLDSPISSSGNYPQINLLSNNFDLNLNSISSQFTASLNNNNNNNNNGYNNGLTQVSARVLLNLFHTPCSTPGAITDLTAAIRAEQLLPGSQLGSELGSPLGLFDEVSGSSAILFEESGSSAILFEESASASASEEGEVITASPIEVSGSSAILLTDESGNSAILSESGSTVVRRRRVQSFW